MNDKLVKLINDVREADKGYMQFNNYRTRDDEAKLWRIKSEARRALRSAIYDELGVSVEELHVLCQS